MLLKTAGEYIFKIFHDQCFLREETQIYSFSNEKQNVHVCVCVCVKDISCVLLSQIFIICRDWA